MECKIKENIDNMEKCRNAEKKEILKKLIQHQRQRLDDFLHQYDTIFNDNTEVPNDKLEDYLSWLGSEINELFETTKNLINDQENTNIEYQKKWDVVVTQFMPFMMASYFS